MTKREKLYGWIIVAALAASSITTGGTKYFSHSCIRGFSFFALAAPVILIVTWLWIQERAKRK